MARAAVLCAARDLKLRGSLMTGRRMDWRKARLYGRPSLDFRREYDVPDRAAKWLQAVERRQRERRTLTAPSSAIAVRSSSR
jgi:hypothetical protein